METLRLTVVDPEKHVFTRDVSMVVIPGTEGMMGVLPRHSAVITTLKPGLLTYYENQQRTYVYVGKGFANVNETGCTVMADSSAFLKDLREDDLKQIMAGLEADLEMLHTEEERAMVRDQVRDVSFQLETLRRFKH